MAQDPPIVIEQVVDFELLPSAARTANGEGSSFNFGDSISRALILLDVTAVSGALPTLNVYVQARLPDGTFADWVAFQQVTAVSKRVASGIVPASSAEFVPLDAALLAGSVQAGLPGGGEFRIKWKISGVGASFTFGVKGNFG